MPMDPHGLENIWLSVKFSLQAAGQEYSIANNILFAIRGRFTNAKICLYSNLELNLERACFPEQETSQKIVIG